MLSRRSVLAGLAVGAATGAAGSASNASLMTAEARLADLERRHGGRLGVVVMDARGRMLAGHRGSERFPLCSVLKLPTVALVLSRFDAGEERLERRLREPSSDEATAVKKSGRLSGATVLELCRSAIVTSDNEAQNLLLRSVGGPVELTRYLRSLGDPATRSDRYEPSLNEVHAGDPRDTTTPLAMAGTLRSVLLGDALLPSSRERLLAWMRETGTGAGRLRAGVAAGWKAGDKTGTGPRNATNDVAVLFPPRRPPLVVAAFHVDSPAPLADREAVLAAVGGLVSGLT